MPVLLANLLARAPKIDDLEAITGLILACDIAEYGTPDCTIEDLLSDWQGSNFSLENDAWVVITNKGQFVGFASVWDREHEQIYTFMCVHPAYRNRGIGTFMLRLTELRARQHISEARHGTRVTLAHTVSDFDQAARQLLEREGYTPVRQFWRMQIEMDESFSEHYRSGKLKIELILDSQGSVSTKQPFKRDGMYAARRYYVYEKELRGGERSSMDQELLPELAVG